MNDTAVEQDSCSRQKSQRSCLNKIINIRHFHKINENWKKKEKKKSFYKSLPDVSDVFIIPLAATLVGVNRWAGPLSWTATVTTAEWEKKRAPHQLKRHATENTEERHHSTSTQIIPQVYVNLGQYKDSFYLNVNDSLKSAVCKI